MARISIVFGDVRSNNAESYIRQRVSLLHHASALQTKGPKKRLSTETLGRYVEGLTAGIDRTSQLPMAAPVDLSSLPGRNGKIIRKRYECMIEEIGRLFPLLDGEFVEEDAVSYLNQDWAEFPADAIVLKRRTNLAVTYYIYPNIHADVENTQLVEHNMVRSERAQLLVAAADTPDFGAAAKTLADGLAGLAPPPFDLLGAALISAFWPSSDDATAQWQQVYTALQQIVKNGLAENDVKQASAKLQGFVTFLNDEYKALKATSSVTKQQLLDALVPYDTAFFLEIVNVFMFTDTSDEGIAAASLANFMTGACLHLALNQERALQDPSVSAPSSSAYAKTVSNLAQTYADYARKAGPFVKDLRLAQISGVQHESNTHCHGGSGASCSTSVDYWFTDSNNDYRSEDFSYTAGLKDPPDAEGDAQRARTAYCNNISSSMDTMLQTQVFDVASTWDKLVSNPVPQPSS